MKKKIVVFTMLILFTLPLLTFLRCSQSSSQLSIELAERNAKKLLADHALLEQLLFLLNTKPMHTDYRESNRVINISHENDSYRLYFLGSTLLNQENNALFKLSPELQKKLAAYFTELIYENYGESISWSEVNILFPKNAYALVTDLETGLSFQIVRKAGSQHADVQPLTAKDTTIMNKIYGGNWSWNRRAVTLTVAGRSIAASMNGMPHGAGSIKNNNFPGHFCIHFLDSKVHKSRTVDLAHQLMIAKASGKIEEEIHQANPEKLITIFFTAIKQHDWNMAGLTLGYKNAMGKELVLKDLQQCEDLKKFIIHKNGELNDLQQITPVNITWKKRGNTKYTSNQLLLSLYKSFSQGEWYIKAQNFFDEN